ncbi:MAG: hypothetical protein JNL01_12485 [Bdellovibrionales bacterium]|nr:hypothetical protein [Bdellovibrionales bacterium]
MNLLILISLAGLAVSSNALALPLQVVCDGSESYQLQFSVDLDQKRFLSPITVTRTDRYGEILSYEQSPGRSCISEKSGLIEGTVRDGSSSKLVIRVWRSSQDPSTFSGNFYDLSRGQRLIDVLCLAR